MSFAFPKSRRLCKRADFLAVQRGGRNYHSRYFVLVLSKHQCEEGKNSHFGGSRLGITVSKKVGNAVVRNRVKRVVREFVRSNDTWLPPETDVVVIAKHQAAKAPTQELWGDLRAGQSKWAH